MNVIKKWNSDYLETLALQEECREKVRLNPSEIFLIICSHPRCYTLGRGLQKIKAQTNLPLIDFTLEQENSLLFPLYKIKRGGGLTFHYPGQLIIYPIVNLTFYKIGVHDLMINILEIIKRNLQNLYNLKNLSINKDLLGLWGNEETKLASIGLAVSHFVTYHGLALNFYHDEDTFFALKNLNPCGLPGHIYKSVETITDLKLSIDSRVQFSQNFEKEFEKLFTSPTIKKITPCLSTSSFV